MKFTLARLLVLSGFLFLALTASIQPASAQVAPGYSLSPTGRALTPGSSQTIQLLINTGTFTATSFVAAIDVTGTGVPSNLAIVPIAPAGMTAQTAAVANITGGKQIQYEVVGGAGSGNLNTNNTWVAVANLTFTAPTSGNAVFTQNNAMTSIFAGASGNVLAGNIAETYLFNSPTPTPTTPPPTPTRTPTPIPPTSTPIPLTSTPAPSSVTLTANFRLQGITTQVTARPITLEVKNAGTTTVRYTNTFTPTISADGLHTITTPTFALSAGNYKICIKGGSHLKRCWDSYALTTGSNTLNFSNTSADLLLVGDVNNDNLINTNDISSINTAYCGFKVAVGSTCGALTVSSAQDVNYDSFITVDDLALALMNFSDFELKGND